MNRTSSSCWGVITYHPSFGQCGWWATHCITNPLHVLREDGLQRRGATKWQCTPFKNALRSWEQVCCEKVDNKIQQPTGKMAICALHGVVGEWFSWWGLVPSYYSFGRASGHFYINVCLPQLLLLKLVMHANNKRIQTSCVHCCILLTLLYVSLGVSRATTKPSSKRKALKHVHVNNYICRHFPVQNPQPRTALVWF